MKTSMLSILATLSLGAHVFAQAALRPGDSVEIRLSGVPAEEIQTFSAPYMVDDAGNLNLPYIKQIHAAGLQPNQVEAAIEDKLKSDGIYTHPSITVIPPAGGRFVSIGGAVRSPGRIPYTPDLTVMATINAAGGFNEFANQKVIRFVHDGKVLKVDIRDIRKKPENDIKVSPGDQIEVSQSWW
jgi:protein involved in polysaccharide export with SLBB domain